MSKKTFNRKLHVRQYSLAWKKKKQARKLCNSCGMGTPYFDYGTLIQRRKCMPCLIKHAAYQQDYRDRQKNLKRIKFKHMAPIPWKFRGTYSESKKNANTTSSTR